MDDFSFYDCSSPFCFLLIEVYPTFPISYEILPNYVFITYWEVYIWMVNMREVDGVVWCGIYGWCGSRGEC